MKYKLFWVSEDKDSSIQLDCYATMEDAERCISGWWNELLDQCGSDEEYHDMQRGEIHIEEASECL